MGIIYKVTNIINNKSYMVRPSINLNVENITIFVMLF